MHISCHIALVILVSTATILANPIRKEDHQSLRRDAVTPLKLVHDVLAMIGAYATMKKASHWIDDRQERWFQLQDEKSQFWWSRRKHHSCDYFSYSVCFWPAKKINRIEEDGFHRTVTVVPVNHSKCVCVEHKAVYATSHSSISIKSYRVPSNQSNRVPIFRTLGDNKANRMSSIFMKGKLYMITAKIRKLPMTLS